MSTETAPDHVDVLIVGAGLSGIGAAYHLQADLPGQDVRDPRGARRDRRHVGPVPLPGHPLGLRPAHARLRVQAVDRATRRSPTAPTILELPPRDRRRVRHRPPHPLRPRVVRAEWSTRRRALDRRRDAQRRPASRHADLLASCSRPPATTTTTQGYTPDVPRHRALRGELIHPQHWPDDLDYDGQARRRDRQRRDRGDARAGDGRPGRARHDAAALAELRHDAAGEGPDRERPAPACCRRPLGLPPHAAQERLAADDDLQAQPAPPDAASSASCARRASASCRAGYDVDTHFKPQLRPVGPAPVRRARRRPVQGDQRGPRVDRHRHASSTFTETRDPARRRATELEADIIVTATGLNLLALRRHASSPSTARDVDARRDDRLQGHDAQRRPELRVRDRLHERVVDAEGRPRLRVRVPAAPPHGRDRPGRVHAGDRRPRHGQAAAPGLRRGLRAPARSTSSPSRARRARGRST